MFLELSKKELQAIKVIRNHLMDEGHMPSVRDLMRSLEYKSPRSAAVLLESFENKGVLNKRADGTYQLNEFDISENFGTREQTLNIPLLGSVACGLPIFAEENVEAHIPISIKILKKGNKYFLLRAKGESMNDAGINHGDLVLIRQQQHAQNGDQVLALIDDEATIKEYHHKGNLVVLKPKSKNLKYQPIILTDEFRIQGVVEAVISV